MNRVLFIDRDGTLIEEPEDKQVDSLLKLQLLPGVIPALLRLKEAGFRFVLVSNQDGLGTPGFPEEHFRTPHRFLMSLLGSQGIEFDAEFICPHLASDNCACRKPKTGLLDDYLAARAMQVEQSYVIGDRDTDMALATNLGIQGARISSEEGCWERVANDLVGGLRSGQIRRATRETDVSARISLNTPRPIEVSSGIGFFDHMLEQVAKHGGFSLRLTCRGDLHVDEHHTVEDVALALGQALAEALGDRRGLGRYGFVLPMDEAGAQVLVDLSGRPTLLFEGSWNREAVGGLPTELVSHFFRSLAESLGAAIHVSVKGENCHHMIEAAFKGLGRCLRQAIRIEDGEMPSTKGRL